MKIGRATQVNPRAKTQVMKLGKLKTPVIVVDDAVIQPESLLEAANKAEFKAQPRDYYPGVRAPVTDKYVQHICEHFFDSWRDIFGLQQAERLETVLSAFSMTTMPANQLKPIQMLPHFDTVEQHQVAVVHYLCDEEHGGTGFYCHKSTSIERVIESNLVKYGKTLKQEAVAAELHTNRKYLGLNHSLFESIGSVTSRFNRLVVYPSNLLHSGLIKPEVDLNNHPSHGRLTTSSFIRFI